MPNISLNQEPEGYYVSNEFLKITPAWRWAFLSRSPAYRDWHARYAAIRKKYQEETEDPVLGSDSLKGPLPVPSSEAYSSMGDEIRPRFGLKRARPPKYRRPERPLSRIQREGLFPPPAYAVWPAKGFENALFYFGFEPEVLERISKSPGRFKDMKERRLITNLTPFRKLGADPRELVASGTYALVEVDLAAKSEDVDRHITQILNALRILHSGHNRGARAAEDKYPLYCAAWDFREEGCTDQEIATKINALFPSGKRATAKNANRWFVVASELITGHKHDPRLYREYFAQSAGPKFHAHIGSCNQCTSGKLCSEGEKLLSASAGSRSTVGRLVSPEELESLAAPKDHRSKRQKESKSRRKKDQ